MPRPLLTAITSIDTPPYHYAIATLITHYHYAGWPLLRYAAAAFTLRLLIAIRQASYVDGDAGIAAAAAADAATLTLRHLERLGHYAVTLADIEGRSLNIVTPWIIRHIESLPLSQSLLRRSRQ